MKCITLWQPWAHACVVGDKVYETRPRSMSYRGILGIHAAASWDSRRVSEKLERLLVARWGDDWQSKMAFGAIVGHVEVVDCFQMTPDFIRGLSYQEGLLGDWQVGRWAYKLANPVKYYLPIAARGYQSMPWNWSP